MSLTPPGSRSSAELEPGTLIAGFRLERVIGRGPHATVYEATQVSLDRRVAFKLFDDAGLAGRIRQLEWPEHPAAVSLFGTGDSEHGPWLAMRLVGGGVTLAARGARLDEVAAALDRAHAQGIVHGDLKASNVLVAGDRAYVSDFGLGPEHATAADDRAALAALVRAHPPRVSHRRTAVLAVAAGLAAAAVLYVVLSTGREDTGGAKPPPVPAGTRALGSALPPGGIESVDCNGGAPSGASPACTMSQLRLDGRPVVVGADGTITSWAVRGARGRVSLQVLRDHGGGRMLEIERTPDESVEGPGVHVATAGIAVRAGDRMALWVTPGAAAGIRRSPRAALERWFGPLVEPPRPPERPAGTGFDDELLLRVAIRARRGGGPAGLVQGAAAERVRRGEEVASIDVTATGGAGRTLSIERVGRSVVVDLLDGSRRLARAPVPGADARGRIAELTPRPGYVRVTWRNPGGASPNRTFEIGASGLS
jgi:hypothetical protein